MSRRSTGQLRRAMCLLILGMGLPIAAEAQKAASSLRQMRELVSVGDDVILTDLQGRRIRGRVAEISSSTIGLIVDGARTDFAEGDLDTISQRDSRWNGTLWGLGVGGALGAGLDRSLVKEYGREDIGVGDSVAFIAEAAAVGAGIGFVVDALIKGERLLYARSQTSTIRSATLRLMWLHGRKGVLLSLRF